MWRATMQRRNYDGQLGYEPPTVSPPVDTRTLAVNCEAHSALRRTGYYMTAGAAIQPGNGAICVIINLRCG